MAVLQNLRCPSCGAPLENVENTRCAYCGQTILIEKARSTEKMSTSDTNFFANTKETPLVKTVVTPLHPSQHPHSHHPHSHYDYGANSKRLIAVLIALVFGVFGAQFFYLGRFFKGFVCVLFFWTGIPAVIGVIHAIILALTPNDEFERKYYKK